MIITDHKILSNLCDCYRSGGHTIVMASGAFDILHVGHIRYLRESKKYGSILIVALNSDSSVLSYKKIHVYQPLKERMEIIDSIQGVKVVTCFDESTAHKMIDVIHPHVYAKGTDYSSKNLLEYNYLMELGIKLVFVGDEKTHSSGKIKDRFLKQKEQD